MNYHTTSRRTEGLHARAEICQLAGCAAKPLKLAAKVEQYLRFAGECRTQKLTGKKRKLNTQPLNNKLRTEYSNVCALDQMHKDASARDAAFAAFIVDN